MRLVACEELEALCRNLRVLAWQILPIGPAFCRARMTPKKDKKK